MIKIKITPARFAEATSILDYLAITGGNRDAALRLLPRFIVGDDNEYIIKVVYDEDGDIERFENFETAALKLTAITPKRSERLIIEVLEAARTIVNPPKDVGSNTPTSTDTEKPPTGS